MLLPSQRGDLSPQGTLERYFRQRVDGLGVMAQCGMFGSEQTALELLDSFSPGECLPAYGEGCGVGGCGVSPAVTLLL